MASFSGLTAVGVPPLPKWLLFVRIAILVLSLAVLIAAAYNVSIISNDIFGYYVSTPAGFIIFDAIFTFIVVGTMLGLEFFAPRFYYRLAFLVLLVLNAIFWLSGWAWAASWAGIWLTYPGSASFGGSMAASAALGAFVWVLIIVTIVFFVRACMRHTTTTSAVDGAEMGHQKPVGPTTTAEDYPAPYIHQQQQQQQQQHHV